MGDWRTTAVMPDPSHDIKDLSSISGISASRLNSSMTRSYSIFTAFCSEDNLQQCLAYVNQEVSSLGLSSLCLEVSSGGVSAVSALNLLYEVLALRRKVQSSLEQMETRQIKNDSDLEHLLQANSRLKDQLEHSRRENSGLHEGERQLQLKIKTLQNCLKSEKEEVQKLQSIIFSRATQYSHDCKRKERESVKLKERLNQLLMDKRDKKLAIEVSNYIGRSDGKRGLWKTSKMESRHESEMYKALLSDYEGQQKSLMLENSELKKVLQNMKKDMIAILSPQKPSVRAEDSLDQVGCEVDSVVLDTSRDALEQSCEQAREQLTNSIRLQWRKLKSHVERLDSRVSLEREGEEMISRIQHEEELQRLRMEMQQCKDFIHVQQQLLQQQLSSACDEETAALLNDCYTLEDKERLKEEWRLFTEQKKNFDKERRNFTEAAIRLGHERKSFEEDRAVWLKTQFLNMTPFVERKRPAESESRSAGVGEFFIAEPEAKLQSQKQSRSHSLFSTPRPSGRSSLSSPRPSGGRSSLSTPELYHTLRLRPDSQKL